jgi:hypothetical protein
MQIEKSIGLACLCCALAVFAIPALAQGKTACKVLDPELQQSYSGPCVEGAAEGYGEAQGIASYKGEFKAGRKHGAGVKIWPATGDRYEGGFAGDRKEGLGTYVWGERSPWRGEKYTGSYRGDRREGFSVYEWPNGDSYSGHWKSDAITSAPTPAMYERARAYAELTAAVGRPGAQVCREMTVGIGTKDWIRGFVTNLQEGVISVRVDDAGQFQHMIGNRTVKKGDEVQEPLHLWTLCATAPKPRN